MLCLENSLIRRLRRGTEGMILSTFSCVMSCKLISCNPWSSSHFDAQHQFVNLIIHMVFPQSEHTLTSHIFLSFAATWGLQITYLEGTRTMGSERQLIDSNSGLTNSLLRQWFSRSECTLTTITLSILNYYDKCSFSACIYMKSMCSTHLKFIVNLIYKFWLIDLISLMSS